MINNRFNVVYHLLDLVIKNTNKIRNMESKLATKTFLINGKDVEFTINELSDTLGHTICLINVLGEKYWEECKKVFIIEQTVIDRIDRVFNN